MNNQIKEDMKSILDNRPELVKEVNKVAEVAGYLWQKGWAERNGSKTNRCNTASLERLLFLLQRNQYAYAGFGTLAYG